MSENVPIGVACLVVLVGPPGSGKTTWARRNGRGAVHVSQDDLIDAITPGGFEHVYRPVYREAEDAVARAALRAGHTVIVDRTNRTAAHRRRWIEIAREARRPVFAVLMMTPEVICRQRNRERAGSRRLGEERMDRMFQALEPVTTGEGFRCIYEGGSITLSEILRAHNLQVKEEAHEHSHQAW